MYQTACEDCVSVVFGVHKRQWRSRDLLMKPADKEYYKYAHRLTYWLQLTYDQTTIMFKSWYILTSRLFSTRLTHLCRSYWWINSCYSIDFLLLAKHFGIKP